MVDFNRLMSELSGQTPEQRAERLQADHARYLQDLRARVQEQLRRIERALGAASTERERQFLLSLQALGQRRELGCEVQGVAVLDLSPNQSAWLQDILNRAEVQQPQASPSGELPQAAAPLSRAARFGGRQRP